IELYSKAAEVGHLNAQYNLALCYVNGSKTTKDSEKAIEVYSKATEVKHLNAQYNLALSYTNGSGMTKDSEKAFELYSKAAETGHLDAQYNLALCYANGSGTTKDSEKAFEFYSKTAEVEDLDAQNNLAYCYLNGRRMTKDSEKAFELYSKAAESISSKLIRNNRRSGKSGKFESTNLYWNVSSKRMRNTEAGNQNTQYNLGWCYQNGWGTTKNIQKAFEVYLKAAEANNLCFKYRNDLKGEFLNFEAFFDQLSDEFKCFKCGNLGIIINESPICPFCDTNKRDDTIKIRLLKCLECYKTSKDLFWCKSCEYSRFYKILATWDSGNENINHATCKYILECYGITKDITTDEYVMVLLFVEHGDLRAFLKLNKDILIWDINILVLKTNPLKVIISDLGLCYPADYIPQSGKINGVLKYLAPEICKGSYHTKYSNIYSFAMISCEIILGERPLNNTHPIHVCFDVIDGKRPIIKQYTPQCIREMIEKNWQYDPYCRNTAEQFQQSVIAAHDHCNLNELVYEKRFYSEEIKDAQHDKTRYKSQHILNFTCSMSALVI
ncbi:hypothetical protein G9A89_002841, partial [Geosiphon pyriformis]